LADFFAAHEEDIESASGGHGGEWDETAEDEPSIWRDALETRDDCVKTKGDRAGCRNGEEVGFNDFGGGERSRFIGIGVVDCNVEGLVSDLPEKSTSGLKRIVNLLMDKI
jgi:hypothetical protein